MVTPTDYLLKQRTILQKRLNNQGDLSVADSLRLLEITQELDRRHANA